MFLFLKCRSYASLVNHVQSVTLVLDNINNITYDKTPSTELTINTLSDNLHTLFTYNVFLIYTVTSFNGNSPGRSFFLIPCELHITWELKMQVFTTYIIYRLHLKSSGLNSLLCVCRCILVCGVLRLKNKHNICA